MRFSLPAGVYPTNLTLRLAGAVPTANIRFTLDGSDPSPTAARYSSANPITLSNTTCVRAAVFEGDQRSSPVAAQSFVLVAPEFAPFSSSLPLVIINTHGNGISREEKAPISLRIIAPRTGRAPLLGPPDFDGLAEINLRGHSSLRYPKRSFHINLRDPARASLDASLLGMPKDSDWVLYAPFPDKTLMRDVLAYDLSNRIGRYAPRTRFVEVFVNTSGERLSARHYAGVYVLEEKIKRGKDRVRLRKITPSDTAEPEITGGYIFKKDHSDDGPGGNPGMNWNPMGGGRLGGFSNSREGFPTPAGAFPGDPAGFLPTEGAPYEGFADPAPRQGRPGRTGFYTGLGSQFFYVEPKPAEITPPQRTWLARRVEQFEDALYGPRFRDRKEGYASFIDSASFIDHHLLVEITKNIDGFRFSTFFHMDRGGPITMGPIWDWNLSLGNANGKQGWIPEHWYWPQLDDQQYSWFRRLFEDPDFAQRYVDRWAELRSTHFATASIHAQIDGFAAELREAQQRNFQRWPILGQPVWPNTFVGDTFQDEVDWMKQWIQTRLAWIENQFPHPPRCSPPPGPLTSGALVRLRASTGEVYVTLDGTDPRAPGGGKAPNARLYSAPFPLTPPATLTARLRSGTRWSPPARFVFEAAPPPP